MRIGRGGSVRPAALRRSQLTDIIKLSSDRQDHFEVYLDGANLTNQGSRRYGDQSRYPIEFERFGRRYLGGVRFKF